MSHDYNARTKRQVEENNTSVAIENLETKLVDGFSSLKYEVINLKYVIIGRLARRKCKVKEQSRGS